MRKFRSELYEAIYEDFLDDFESGIISEAEFREFEADAFIDEDDARQLVGDEADESQEQNPLLKEHITA